MYLQLINNKSAKNVVHKNLTVITTFNGDVLEDFNIESPTFTVPIFSDFNKVNYAYINDLGRYYFVRIEVLTGQLLKLTLKSDALTSFWGSFGNSPCIAKRSSSAPDYRIADGRELKLPKPHIVYRKTNLALTPATTNNYILTLTGK